MFRTITKIVGGFLVAVALLGVPAITAGQSLLARFTDQVSAFHADRWTRFVSPGYHQLEVEGDGDTDLDCYVENSAGQVLGSDTDSTDYCIVRWYQSRGHQVSFRIENLGDVYNRYEFRLW